MTFDKGDLRIVLQALSLVEKMEKFISDGIELFDDQGVVYEEVSFLFGFRGVHQGDKLVASVDGGNQSDQSSQASEEMENGAFESAEVGHDDG